VTSEEEDEEEAEEERRDREMGGAGNTEVRIGRGFAKGLVELTDGLQSRVARLHPTVPVVESSSACEG